MQGIYPAALHNSHVVFTLYERMIQLNASLAGQSDGRSCSDTSSVNHRDVRASAQAVEVIRPSLHHLAQLVETLRTIVGSTNLVTLHVAKLQLDKIRMPAARRKARKASPSAWRYGSRPQSASGYPGGFGIPLACTLRCARLSMDDLKTCETENTGNTAFLAQCWDATEHCETLWNGKLVRADGIEPPTFAV